MIQPKLLICGHIHGAHGTDRIGDTLVANVARLDDSYRPKHPPMTFDVASTVKRTDKEGDAS